MTNTMNLNKSLVPTEQDMIANLLVWYALSQRDRLSFQSNFNWYVNANRQCQEIADSFALTLHMTTQVVACISPAKKWTLNIRDAVWVIEAYFYTTVTEERMAYLLQRGFGVGYTWDNAKKAWLALDGWSIPPESEKTYNFAHNLEFPEETSFEYGTIDQHMVHIICGTKLKGTINPSGYYQRLKSALIKAAHILNILPQQLQAAVWGFRVDAFEAGMSVVDIYSLIDELAL